MSSFISAYGEGYSTQHVLVRLTEKCRENLDDDYIVGGVLMDLSKAFDCIPHDLLIARLDSYCVTSYLHNRKQCVRIDISGETQGPRKVQ